MYRTLIILLIAGFLVSCGNQRRLVKTYEGKPVSSLKVEFGNPAAVIENANDSIFIFEKAEELRGTEISQGRTSLDPIYTPPVTKTNRFYFTVQNGVITDVRSEEEYDRE